MRKQFGNSCIESNCSKGSITVMVGLLLPVMLLMILLLVNINQLIFTKVRLQNTVDACALSAATVQSAGLNEIADLNHEMVREHQRIVNILASGIWHSQGQAVAAKDYYHDGTSGVLDWIMQYQNRANTRYAQWAESVAQNVKTRNFSESTLTALHNTGKLSTFDVHVGAAAYLAFTESFAFGSGVPTVTWITPHGPQNFTGDHDGRHFRIAKRSSPVPGFFILPEHIEKVDETYVHYTISLPSQNFVLGEKIFGAMPRLHASAVAKPAGGHISDIRPLYRPVLIR